MKRKPLILVSLLLAAFVINLDTTIVNVALPTLVRQLRASNSQLQWVVDAFNLLFAGSVLAFGSRSIFFAMTPVAAIAGVLVAGYVPTSRDPHAPRTDRAGFALSTAMVALLIYTIIEAPNHGWGSARTLGSFALTAVLAAAFVRWERRAEEPMLDLSLFGDLRFTAASGSV